MFEIKCDENVDYGFVYVNHINPKRSLLSKHKLL